MSRHAVALLVLGLALTPLGLCLLAWASDVRRRRRQTVARRLPRERVEAVNDRHRPYRRRA